MDNKQVEAALAHLINTPYSESVISLVKELTGRARVAGPNDVTTRELDPNRVHIKVEAGKITGFAFN